MRFDWLINVLCREPFAFTPTEVGRLTPAQVAIILCERNDRGVPLLPDSEDDEQPFDPRELVAQRGLESVFYLIELRKPRSEKAIVRIQQFEQAAAVAEQMMKQKHRFLS